MAERLEWNGVTLRLGPFVLAEVGRDDQRRARYRIGRKVASDPYESMVDCMQDCESEVRRLLKEAGVEVGS